MDELVAIARIVKPRGLRGELVADVLTDFPERFEGLAEVRAVLANGESRRLKIQSFWFQKERLVLKFAGIDSIEAGDELRGSMIGVDESDAVKLEEGEFFDWQLEGSEAVTLDGVLIGNVREVMRTGGTEILVINGVDKELLIPFAAAICVEVDVENKRIVIDPPEGLLEF